MRSWWAVLTTLSGVALASGGCGGAGSGHPQGVTSSSTASRTATAGRYSARQIERAFDAAGISLRADGSPSGPLPCPFFAARGRLDITVSTCGDQGETIGTDLPLRRLLRKANVLVMYEMHTAPSVPSQASVLAKIKHALALLPGSAPVSVVHLHNPPDPWTPFTPQAVERVFKGAGVPLKEVRPIDLSGFPNRDAIRAVLPGTELQAAAPLPPGYFVRIIVARHINWADSDPVSVGDGQTTTGSPVRSGEDVLFNVYGNWKLRLGMPLLRNLKTAIKRLEAITNARIAITLGH
jgi:hypothetical protein